MKPLPLLVLLMTGCAVEREAPVVADAVVVHNALSAAQPDAAVTLVEDTPQVLSATSGCPSITSDGEDEIWTGGCSTADGRQVDGILRRHIGLDGGWIASEHFAIRAGDEVVFQLNGAIELFEADDLLEITVSGQLCGTDAWVCSDGLVTLDLQTSIFPASNFPDVYDATVSGVVAPPEASAITIDGVWSIDAACTIEPASGTFMLREQVTQALELDGSVSCDGCAGLTVQGDDASPYCNLSL